MNIQTLESHAGDQGLSAVNEPARSSAKVYPPPAPSQMEGGVMPLTYPGAAGQCHVLAIRSRYLQVSLVHSNFPKQAA